MRVYLLKESDFEKLQLLIGLIEAETEDDAENTPTGALRRKYHYHIMKWIDVMKEPKS